MTTRSHWQMMYFCCILPASMVKHGIYMDWSFGVLSGIQAVEKETVVVLLCIA